jgi:hypothetical protein
MTRHHNRPAPALLESLEPRTLFSASFALLNHPHLLPNGQLMPTNGVASPPRPTNALATVSGVDYSLIARASIVWDDGHITPATLTPGANNTYNLFSARTPLTPGARGVFLGFWQVTKTGKIVNETYSPNHFFVDVNSAKGITFTATAQQPFTGKIGNLRNTIDDAADNQQTPFDLPELDADNNPIPDTYTTLTALVYWGDDSANTRGTLHKNTTTGTWEIWATHTYATPGTYKLAYQLQTAFHAPAGAAIPLPIINISTAIVTAP